MNIGAIEFSEDKMRSLDSNTAIELLLYIHDNLDPGYMVYKSPGDLYYYVGESAVLFDDSVRHIYKIKELNYGFDFIKTTEVFSHG